MEWGRNRKTAKLAETAWVAISIDMGHHSSYINYYCMPLLPCKPDDQRTLRTSL